MYTWPDQTTELNYLTYFLENGYFNSSNGLNLETVGAVSSLPAAVATLVLSNYAALMRDNIESKIVSDGSSGVSNLANTMNNFAATQNAFNGNSELPVENSPLYKPDLSGVAENDQVAFVNSPVRRRPIAITV
jgi:hypothetical protein